MRGELRPDWDGKKVCDPKRRYTSIKAGCCVWNEISKEVCGTVMEWTGRGGKERAKVLGKPLRIDRDTLKRNKTNIPRQEQAMAVVLRMVVKQMIRAIMKS